MQSDPASCNPTAKKVRLQVCNARRSALQSICSLARTFKTFDSFCQNTLDGLLPTETIISYKEKLGQLEQEAQTSLAIVDLVTNEFLTLIQNARVKQKDAETSTANIKKKTNSTSNVFVLVFSNDIANYIAINWLTPHDVANVRMSSYQLRNLAINFPEMMFMSFRSGRRTVSAVLPTVPLGDYRLKHWHVTQDKDKAVNGASFVARKLKADGTFEQILCERTIVKMTSSSSVFVGGAREWKSTDKIKVLDTDHVRSWITILELEKQGTTQARSQDKAWRELYQYRNGLVKLCNRNMCEDGVSNTPLLRWSETSVEGEDSVFKVLVPYVTLSEPYTNVDVDSGTKKGWKRMSITYKQELTFPIWFCGTLGCGTTDIWFATSASQSVGSPRAGVDGAATISSITSETGKGLVYKMRILQQNKTVYLMHLLGGQFLCCAPMLQLTAWDYKKPKDIIRIPTPILYDNAHIDVSEKLQSSLGLPRRGPFVAKKISNMFLSRPQMVVFKQHDNMKLRILAPGSVLDGGITVKIFDSETSSHPVYRGYVDFAFIEKIIRDTSITREGHEEARFFEPTYNSVTVMELMARCEWLTDNLQNTQITHNKITQALLLKPHLITLCGDLGIFDAFESDIKQLNSFIASMGEVHSLATPHSYMDAIDLADNTTPSTPASDFLTAPARDILRRKSVERSTILSSDGDKFQKSSNMIYQRPSTWFYDNQIIMQKPANTTVTQLQMHANPPDYFDPLHALFLLYEHMEIDTSHKSWNCSNTKQIFVYVPIDGLQTGVLRISSDEISPHADNIRGKDLLNYLNRRLRDFGMRGSMAEFYQLSSGLQSKSNLHSTSVGENNQGRFHPTARSDEGKKLLKDLDFTNFKNENSFFLSKILLQLRHEIESDKMAQLAEILKCVKTPASIVTRLWQNGMCNLSNEEISELTGQNVTTSFMTPTLLEQVNKVLINECHVIVNITPWQRTHVETAFFKAKSSNDWKDMSLDRNSFSHIEAVQTASDGKGILEVADDTGGLCLLSSQPVTMTHFHLTKNVDHRGHIRIGKSAGQVTDLALRAAKTELQHNFSDPKMATLRNGIYCATPLGTVRKLSSTSNTFQDDLFGNAQSSDND